MIRKSKAIENLIESQFKASKINKKTGCWISKDEHSKTLKPLMFKAFYYINFESKIKIKSICNNELCINPEHLNMAYYGKIISLEKVHQAKIQIKKGYNRKEVCLHIGLSMTIINAIHSIKSLQELV